MAVSKSKYEFFTDCMYWEGRRPCVTQRKTNQKKCRGCSSYKPCRKNILLIKVGGLGSVTRSLVVAQEFRNKFRHENCKIQYLTHEKGVDLLQYVPAVDRALDINDWKSLSILSVQKFDIIVNFECSDSALVAIKKTKANLKFGFLPDFKGSPYVEDVNSTELARLQTNDYFRREENRKSMQQIFLEVAGLNWNNQRYQLYPKKSDNVYAEKIFSKIKFKQAGITTIGLNIGSSKKQRKKRWSIKRFRALISILHSNHPNWNIVILAGPEESNLYKKLCTFYQKKSLKNIIFPGCHNTIGQFIAIVNNIDLVVSCDTFGMHVAIALGKKVVTLNGPQPIQETEVYGLGEKIENKISCSPCFLAPSNCSMECMEIEEDIVYQVILRVLNLPEVKPVSADSA